LAGCGNKQQAATNGGQTTTDQAATTTEDKVAPVTEEKTPEPTQAKAPEPTSHTYTLPTGTTFTGSLQNTPSSGKNHVDDPFTLHTVLAKTVDGVTVVPAGSTIHGHLSYVDGAGRVAGGAKLTLRFDSIEMADGTSHSISATPLRLEGKGDAKESALEIG